LGQVFHEAKLFNACGRIVGGVRPVKEHEKKRRNHKWFRWFNEDADGFLSELESL
jgi:hypothetical protein